MEDYINISNINDFLYCPKSLYFHNLYLSFSKNIYQSDVQVNGLLSHKTIDEQSYSTSKSILQGTTVFSEKIKVKGKIDIFDVSKKTLIERKHKIKQIYQGYKYQLYAQMYCLQEVGYKVEKIFIQSISDNKRYKVNLPNDQEKVEFESLIEKIRNFSIEDLKKHKCKNCENNIYSLFDW